MKEIWKDIKNFEGYYQVSNLGRVRRLQKTRKRTDFDKLMEDDLIGGCLKIIYSGNDYAVVTLSKNNQHTRYNVARLVGEYFVDNPDNLNCISHKDGDKSNCRADNLEWIKHPTNDDLKKPIKISKGDFVKVFNSRKECCEFFGCTARPLNYRRGLFGDKFEFRGYTVKMY